MMAGSKDYLTFKLLVGHSILSILTSEALGKHVTKVRVVSIRLPLATSKSLLAVEDLIRLWLLQSHN